MSVWRYRVEGLVTLSVALQPSLAAMQVAS